MMRSFFPILLVTAGAAYSQSLSPGLLAEYNDGKTRVHMIASAPEFYLEADESAHPALAAAFEAQWTGLISIVTAGDFTFDAGSAALTIDGANAAGKAVPLAAGRHAFAMRYRRVAGVA